jgi:hypothetical protein
MVIFTKLEPEPCVTVANVVLIEVPVLPEPETSPVRVTVPEIEAVFTAVIKPLPLTVITGMLVADPNEPVLLFTVANVIASPLLLTSPDRFEPDR